MVSKILKRGQVTVFIIVGLFFLIAIILLFSLKQSANPVPEDFSVPESTDPIYLYVKSCVDMKAVDAIQLIGIQGGYIELPDEIARNPYRYLPIAKGGGFRVPYWYYDGKYYVPTTKQIEDEMNNYLLREVPKCIDNFDGFQGLYEITPQKDMVFKTTLGENGGVAVELDWPISVKSRSDNQVMTIPKVIVKKDVRLYDLVKLAAEIANETSTNYFLEDFTINLMSLNQEKIPLGGIDFSCSPKVWMKSQVRSDLQSMMADTVYGIKVVERGSEVGSKNPYYVKGYSNPNYDKKYFKEDLAKKSGMAGLGVPAYRESGAISENYDPDSQQSYAYWNYVLPIDREIKDLRILFNYQTDWPMDLRVNPANGERMAASGGNVQNKFLSYMCIQSWHYVYDINYPVLISIQDDSAFSDDGFTLNFVLPVTIKQNAPDKTPFVYNINPTMETASELCEFGDKDITIIAYPNGGGMDYYTGIKDVKLTYNCMNKYSCELGKTSFNDGTYNLKTKLPSFCDNGKIIAEKDGYLSGFAYSNSESVSIQMEELRPIRVAVEKLRSSQIDLGIVEPEALELGDNAIIMLEKNNTPDYFSTLTLNSSNSTGVMELTTTPGTYLANVILTDEDGNSLGGYYGLLEVTDEVLHSGQVTFYVYQQIPTPSSDDDAAMMKLFTSVYQGTYNSVLTPKFE